MSLPCLWIDLFTLSQEFARKDHGFEVIRVKFFTALPKHKLNDVRARYSEYKKL